MSSTTAELITEECNALRELLLQKNAAYGDAAINPVRIFSKASPEEQIRVRLDDKISRLARGHNAGEDVELDLMGYLVLLRVSRRVQALGSVLQGIREAEEGKTHDLGDFIKYAEPAPTPAIDPGAGYRILDDDEVLREGDEFNPNGDEWEKTTCTGWDVVVARGGAYTREQFPYRRKIEVPGPGERLESPVE